MGRALQTGSEAFKVNSLTDLESARPDEGRVVWDPARSIWNTAMLLGALVLGPLYFTWGALAAFLVLSAATLCAGHSVGFHRRLIHRSFECPKWLERLLVYLGTMVGMGGPIWTIGLHDSRDWAQREETCHWFLRHGKPMWIEGFTYLNFKLILSHPPGFDPGSEIADDPFYRFLQRTWMAQQLPLAALLVWVGGVPWVVWGVVVRVAACTTMHWFISYFAHTRGPQDWHLDGAALQAHNVPIMAIPTMGESWHCNHHAFPRSAAHGLYPGQIDLGFQFIRLLERLGLAWDIKLPANLPPRPGISPVTPRALSVASRGQAAISPWRGTAMEGELAQQVAQLRASHSAGLDEGSGRIWMAQLGDLVLPLPNFAWRREALDVHDANHLTTGYDFSPAGECRLAAWELGCGCYRSRYARALCVALLVAGLVFGPVATWKAWRAGRRVSAKANLPTLR